MSNLNVRSFQESVDDMVLAWASTLNISPILISGDPLLAIFQAFSGQTQYLQGLVQLVETLCRASTSTGTDLDSWVADFGLTRLPASKAYGTARFGVAAIKSNAILIPISTVIQAAGGSIQYQVIADTNKAGYSPSNEAYILQPGENNVDATVEALIAGSLYNVQPNQLSQLFTPLPGIDTVTNLNAITNGIDAQSDEDLRAAFVVYLATLARGTRAAILAAVDQVEPDLFINIVENTKPDLSTQYGFFTVFVDDGSGEPPSSLLTAIGIAIESVRAFTVQYAVAAPTPVTATVHVHIKVPTTYTEQDKAVAQAAVKQAIINMVNDKNIAQYLYTSDIDDAAKTITGVVSVQSSAITINGSAADLSIAVNQVVRTDSDNVTVGLY